MARTTIVTLALSLTLAGTAPTVAAFTFADGTTAPCVARGEVVKEITAAPDDPDMQRRTGWARRVDGRWQITWNAQRLAGLTPEVRDFLFFHECAHARVPTEVELEANCAGLIDMRLAGRATPELEAKLRAQYGKVDYWKDTFACADAWFARERATGGTGGK
jgi:hypothetical protein